MARDGSSRMSPYLRFGIISVRQLYNHIKKLSAQNYLFELGRREFWQHIAGRFPEARFLEFQEKRRDLKRENDEVLFQKFCAAQTGYPLIDAAILQLKKENWMHNRARMFVASFLCKDLLIDRRRGEEFFKKYLLDYDENINIGNWQRSASVGADPKPIRIFSPIRQAERFDPEAKYIQTYLPELEFIPIPSLHDPITYPIPAYPKPIVNHKERVPRAKEMYYG